DDRGAGETELISDRLLGDGSARLDRGERAVQRGREPQRREAIVDALADAVVSGGQEEAGAPREAGRQRDRFVCAPGDRTQQREEPLPFAGRQGRGETGLGPV